MQINGLDAINYDEAARLTGATRSTIQTAISHGILTPFRRRSRQPGYLARAQVELFLGKNLSLKQLSPEEAVRWMELKQQITTRPLSASERQALALDILGEDDKIAFIGALMEGAADILVMAFAGVLEMGDITPDKFLERMGQSPDFKRLLGLLGVDMQDIPDKVTQAMSEKMEEIAERVSMRLMQLFMKAAARTVSNESEALPEGKGTSGKEGSAV
jgi:hypothetical protein